MRNLIDLLSVVQYDARAFFARELAALCKLALEEAPVQALADVPKLSTLLPQSCNHLNLGSNGLHDLLKSVPGVGFPT